MNPRRFLPQVVLAFLLLLVPLFIAATSVGRIKGTVVDDKTGEPLYGVSIQIEGTTMGAKSNIDGNFVIKNLPPGIYALLATSIGYELAKIAEVKVDSDRTIAVEIRMKQLVLQSGNIIEVKKTSNAIDFKATGTQIPKNQQNVQQAPKPTADDLRAREMGITFDTEPESRVSEAGKGERISIPDCVQSPRPPQAVSREKDKAQHVPSEIVRHTFIQKPRPIHPPPSCPPYPYLPWYINGEPYDAMYFQDYGTNPFIDTEDDNLSTFAIDVDDASYILARSYLERGDLPPADAVRVEEFVNHFDYGYDSPRHKPFAVYLEGAPSRFGRNSHLLRIGIKGREIAEHQRKPANLVFVIDVSGSMNRENRLGMVKKALYFLVDELEKHDRVGIVTFNTFGQVVLPLTSVRHRSRIFEAIEHLYGSGSTNVGEGLNLGYKMSRRNFDEEKTNRIILCSDGVANTGTTNPDEMLRRIKKSADMGITLSTVGVGMGNYNDVLLEKLGDKGNGKYAYVDDLEEARRVFVENLTGTLEVIARDVKIQVDFDPEVVRSYRLLGFENRDVADHKFRDDRVDGGEIGAGHEVTALYEIKFEGRARADRLGTIFVRFKDADGREVDEVQCSITRAIFNRRFGDSTPQFKLAAAAAEFAEILKGTPWSRRSSMHAVYNLARDVSDVRASSEVDELMRLVKQADRFMDSRAER